MIQEVLRVILVSVAAVLLIMHAAVIADPPPSIASSCESSDREPSYSGPDSRVLTEPETSIRARANTLIASAGHYPGCYDVSVFRPTAQLLSEEYRYTVRYDPTVSCGWEYPLEIRGTVSKKNGIEMEEKIYWLSDRTPPSDWQTAALRKAREVARPFFEKEALWEAEYLAREEYPREYRDAVASAYRKALNDVEAGQMDHEAWECEDLLVIGMRVRTPPEPFRKSRYSDGPAGRLDGVRATVRVELNRSTLEVVASGFRWDLEDRQRAPCVGPRPTH